jgi:Flp pilus assembly protein TadG
MDGQKRSSATNKIRTAKLPMGQPWREHICAARERGSAAVELALTLPILLLLLTGIFSFGTYLQQYMQLTDAVNVGAMWLAVNRDKTLDPCNLAYTAVVNAAPNLTLTGSNFTYNLDGNAESGSSCSSASSDTGAPSYMVQGTPVTVTVQNYPCSLFTFMGDLAPSCTMTVSLTEIMQ